jgi:predicted site-specific integrase-resolvase
MNPCASAPTRLTWIAVMILFEARFASAQQTNDLQLQLQQLKQQYEQSTQDFQAETWW